MAGRWPHSGRTLCGRHRDTARGVRAAGHSGKAVLRGSALGACLCPCLAERPMGSRANDRTGRSALLGIAVTSEERCELVQDLRVDPALDEPPAASGPDEAGPSELLEVVRRRGWCYVDALRQVTNASAALLVRVAAAVRDAARRQPLEEFQAVWVREGREDGRVSFEFSFATFCHMSNRRSAPGVCQALSGSARDARGRRRWRG